MTTLLALCHPSGGSLHVKRVQIAQPVQTIIEGLFQQQANDFLEGVHEEILFGGDWKPDTDEILVLDAPNEIALMQSAMVNPIGLDTIDSEQFASEGIKGLFVGIGQGDSQRFFIQSFSAQQFLARNRIALIFESEVFRQITEPSFALDSKLVAIAEGGKLKFKSFFFLKRIFPLDEVYRVATDQQIDGFLAHQNLSVPDVMAFKSAADQQIRRLVHAVSTANVLGNSPVADIQTKAASLGVSIVIEGGKIVFPLDRRQIKELLRFLDDSIYEGPLSARRLITNSKRPFGS